MNKTYSLDGVQAILSYPFKAPGWQSKFLIGAALFFANYIIPILPAIVLYGYFAKIMRSVIVENVEPTLPEWDDWGTLFSSGLKVFGAALVYVLPGLVFLIGGYIMMFIPLMLSGFSDPTGHGTSSSMVGLSLLGTFGGLFMFFLGFILILLSYCLLPPAIAHVVAKDSFIAAFRIGEWWAILRANFWGFFTAVSVILGIYTILIMAVYILYFTIILCILMPILLSVVCVYLSVISAPLLGEAYRKGVENLTPVAAA
jgi:hypothetical protein